MNNEVSTTALVIIAASGGVGALIAGLVAAWVNLLTERSRAKREKATWLREKKMSAFALFLANARIAVAAASAGATAHEAFRTSMMQFNQSEFEVRLLLGPSRVAEFNRLRALVSGVSKGDKDAADEANSSIHKLTVMLREELDLRD